MQQIRRVLAYMAGRLPMAFNAAGTTDRRHQHMQAPTSKMLYQAQAKVTYRAFETARKTARKTRQACSVALPKS